MHTDVLVSVVVQGGQEPEFEIRPDPAKMQQAGVTIPNMLDAVKKLSPSRGNPVTNMWCTHNPNARMAVAISAITSAR